MFNLGNKGQYLQQTWGVLSLPSDCGSAQGLICNISTLTSVKSIEVGGYPRRGDGHKELVQSKHGDIQAEM